MTRRTWKKYILVILLNKSFNYSNITFFHCRFCKRAERSQNARLAYFLVMYQHFLLKKECIFILPSFPVTDMSDVVPPEVRPKPAVPAKPPNVGVPSPSSPFPPQAPGIGGGAPPPSAIPVPIGSHGSQHISTHSVGHGVGHGAGHVAGHTAAHNGAHAHGGSHSSGSGSTLLGYIGIDTIIEQMRKKTMKTGFDFNIMVVGKWKMINSLKVWREYNAFFCSLSILG